MAHKHFGRIAKVSVDSPTFLSTVPSGSTRAAQLDEDATVYWEVDFSRGAGGAAYVSVLVDLGNAQLY